MVEFYVPNDDEMEREIEKEELESDYEDVEYAELEMYEPPTQALDEEDGVLACISGESKYTTMKVAGNIDENSIIVLIDGGATHNSIDEKFVVDKKVKIRKFCLFWC